jgi:MFS family permease
MSTTRPWYEATLGNQASLFAAAALLGVIYAGSTIVTPLYPLYQRAFGISEVAVTLVYATYVIGNLGALFVFGRVSDQAGRRLVSLLVLAVAGLSTLLFLFAVHPAMLFIARAASGLAIGVGAATVTAWIADLYPADDKARASRLAAAVNLVGLAVGVMISGLLARFAPWPLRSVYVIYLSVLLLSAVLIARTRETVKFPARSSEQVSLRPRVGVPADARMAFVAPAVTAFATFALLGFYAALAPNLLAHSMNLRSPVVSGAIVAELFAAGAVTVMAAPMLASQTTMFIGLWLLIPSLGLLLWAQAAGSLAVLVAATALCGVSSAFGFRGSLQEVNRIAPGDRRAEVLSAYLLCCYSGNSLPAVGVSVLSRQLGHLWADVVFAIVSAVLALIALAVGSRVRRSTD